MKHKTSQLFNVSLFSLLFYFSSFAQAIPISSVGAVDQLQGQTEVMNNSDATEISWAQSILGDNTITQDYKYGSSAGDWQSVDGETDQFAIQFQGTPDYYLLKFGVGNYNIDTHYLMLNVNKLNYAVIDFSDMGLPNANNFGIGRVSHISEYDSNILTPQAVPTPNTILLLMFALMTLVMVKQVRNAQMRD